jgi:hypothetical protein
MDRSVCGGRLKRNMGASSPAPRTNESLRTIARVLEHPWNRTLSLGGDFQQLPGVEAIESSGFMERAMGIEPTSEAWELWRRRRMRPSLLGPICPYAKSAIGCGNVCHAAIGSENFMARTVQTGPPAPGFALCSPCVWISRRLQLCHYSPQETKIEQTPKNRS